MEQKWSSSRPVKARGKDFCMFLYVDRRTMQEMYLFI